MQVTKATEQVNPQRCAYLYLLVHTDNPERTARDAGSRRLLYGVGRRGEAGVMTRMLVMAGRRRAVSATGGGRVGSAANALRTAAPRARRRPCARHVDENDHALALSPKSV